MYYAEIPDGFAVATYFYKNSSMYFKNGLSIEELEKSAVHEFIHYLQEIKDKKVEYIVGAEARGFMIGAAVANQLNIGFVPVRKAGKLPPITVEKQFSYEKEYGKDKMELPKLVDEEYTGKRIYMIDDIYATGNTMKAMKQAIEDVGGIVVGQGVIMNIKELNDANDIYSLIDINET